MSLRPRTILTIEGWCYLVGAGFFIGGAVVRNINLLVALAAMMLATLVINWRWVVATMRRIDVRRQLPPSVIAGELVTVELDIVNQHRRRAAWVLLMSDRLERVGAAKAEPNWHPPVLVNHVPANQTRRGTYRVRLTRRGRYRLGPLEIATRFPFGLVRSSLTVDRNDHLLVYPRAGRLTERWKALERDGDAARRAQFQKQQPLEGDFHSLRDWRAGDARRTIHWRTSARRAQLMVRQFEQQRRHNLVVIVDLWQPEAADDSALETVELAVSFAASVITDACRHGSAKVAVGIGGREPVWRRGHTSLRLLDELREQLAVAEASPADRLPELLAAADEEIGPRDKVVLITTREVQLTDPRISTSLPNHRERRAWLNRVLTVNAATDHLLEYFLPDEAVSATESTDTSELAHVG